MEERVRISTGFVTIDTDDSIVNRMHLSMHRQGLSASLALIITIIMRTVVVMTRRDHFATLDKDRTESKAHGALRGGIGALKVDDKQSDNNRDVKRDRLNTFER